MTKFIVTCVYYIVSVWVEGDVRKTVMKNKKSISFDLMCKLFFRDIHATQKDTTSTLGGAFGTTLCRVLRKKNQPE